MANSYPSESTFSEIVDNINCGVAIYEAVDNGRDFILKNINRMGEKISDVSREYVIGRRILDLFPGVKHIGLLEVLQRVLKTGAPAYHPAAQYQDSRISGWVENYAFKLSTGKIVTVYTDGTARREAETSLRESEARFRLLVQNVILGICIIKDDCIAYASPVLETINGSAFDSLETGHFSPAGLKKIKQFYKKLLDTGGSTGGSIGGVEVRFYPDGRADDDENMKWVHCKGNVIDYEGGKAVMLAMVDVTRVKEMERVMQLREKMASLGHVAAGIAHEIRNPLSGINVLMEGIRENFEEPENAQDIKMLIGEVQKASNKIESIIKRVLDFAKPGYPQLEKTDINVPIREAIELSQAALRKMGVSIDSQLADNLPPLYIDSQLLEQVILNLITNAAEAMLPLDGEKRISVASWRCDDDICISFADTGPGVPEKIRKKIFDPFYTTKADGSGIGLSFCQRVLTDHNGTIALFPGITGGALFRIKLPIEKRDITR